MHIDELLKVFSANLRTRRQELGLSQAALAEEMGISQNHVCLYETGGRRPTLATLAAFSEALRCSPGTLLTAGAFAPAEKSAEVA